METLTESSGSHRRVGDAGQRSQRFQSRAHPRTWVSVKPLLHNNICSTPSHFVQEGTVSIEELCLGGEPST
jgi:hypothetical protein